jgi:quercetin dioxygenase-like cupin family protein
MRFSRKRLPLIGIGLTFIAAAVVATIALASPGSGISTTVLAPRSTFSDAIQLSDDGIRFQTDNPTDFVTQQVTFAPGAFSGWHHRPGFILVLVTSGHVTTHNANCQTKTYGPGQAFVESGTAPFEVTNDSKTDTAVDVGTQVAPAGSPFRVEDDPPPCAQAGGLHHGAQHHVSK